jgi:carbonic anhydrase
MNGIAVRIILSEWPDSLNHGGGHMNQMRSNAVTLIIALCMVLLPIMGSAENAGNPFDVMTKKLLAGNARFFNNKRSYPNLDKARLAQTAKGQHPYATVLACSDSRVPVEHIFDAGIGDIFVVKVAGNVIGTDEIGSIEYGTEHLKTPVLVVMGHTSCGAVTAAVRDDHVEGSIRALIGKIKPAVEKARKQQGNEISDALIDTAIRMNIFQSMEEIFKKSRIVTGLVKEHKLVITGALYHIDTGMVEWLGAHPDQASFISEKKENGTPSIPGGMWYILYAVGGLFLVALVYFIIGSKFPSIRK